MKLLPVSAWVENEARFLTLLEREYHEVLPSGTWSASVRGVRCTRPWKSASPLCSFLECACDIAARWSPVRMTPGELDSPCMHPVSGEHFPPGV